MMKYELLAYLVKHGDVDAQEVAQAFELPYAAAAMALLRLSRQSLVKRYVDTERSVFWYRISRRGAARLTYLQDS